MRSKVLLSLPFPPSFPVPEVFFFFFPATAPLTCYCIKALPPLFLPDGLRRPRFFSELPSHTIPPKALRQFNFYNPILFPGPPKQQSDRSNYRFCICFLGSLVFFSLVSFPASLCCERIFLFPFQSIPRNSPTPSAWTSY